LILSAVARFIRNGCFILAGFLWAVVAEAQISIDPPSTTFSGTTGSFWSQTFSASGGSWSYTWSDNTTLPGWLSLDTMTATVGGTPTTAGTYYFSIYVSDDSGSTWTSVDYTLVISDPPPPLTISGSLTGGVTGGGYSQSLFASGGAGGNYWWVSGGSLPAGLSLDSSSGTISGTPTSAGTCSFTVAVTDAAATTAAVDFQITIYDPPQISGMLPDGTANVAYSQALVVSGGSGSYSWTMSGQPGWLQVDSSGTLSGTPASPGTYYFTVTVTDLQSGGTAQGVFGMTIYGPTPLAVSDVSVTAGITDATINFTVTMPYGGDSCQADVYLAAAGGSPSCCGSYTPDANGLVVVPISGLQPNQAYSFTIQTTANIPNWGVYSVWDGAGGFQTTVDSVLEFSAATYQANENDGSATITINRSGGCAGTVSVDYSGDGNGTVTFDPWETSKTFTVPITDDGFYTGDSTFTLVLSNAQGGAVVGSQSVAVLTIVENESPPVPPPPQPQIPPPTVSMWDLRVDTVNATGATISWVASAYTSYGPGGYWVLYGWEGSWWWGWEGGCGYTWVPYDNQVNYSWDGGSGTASGSYDSSTGRVTVTLTGLTPGQSYNFAGVSSCGDASASEAGQPFTTPGFHISSSPTINNVTLGRATVSWQVENTSGMSLHHVVYYSGNDANGGSDSGQVEAETSANTGPVSITLADLHPAFNYSVWVQSGFDDGSYIVTDTAQGANYTFTTATPVSLNGAHVENVTPSSVDIVWDLGFYSCYTCDWAAHTVNFSDIDPSGMQNQSVSVVTNSLIFFNANTARLTLAGLQAGHIYACSLQTVLHGIYISYPLGDGSGWAGWSSTEDTVLTNSLQVATQCVQISGSPAIVDVSTNSVTVGWEVANFSGQPATHTFSVLASDGNGNYSEIGNSTTSNADSGWVQLTVQGLLPGVDYRFVVRSAVEGWPDWFAEISNDPTTNTPLTFATPVDIYAVTGVDGNLTTTEGDTIHAVFKWLVQPTGVATNHAVIKADGTLIATGLEDSSGLVSATFDVNPGDRWPLWVRSSANSSVASNNNFGNYYIVEGLPLVTISNVNAAAISSTNAFVAWSVDSHGVTLSSNVVYYWCDPAVTNTAVADFDMEQGAAVALLTGLVPNTNYSFTVLSDTGLDPTLVVGPSASANGDFFLPFSCPYLDFNGTNYAATTLTNTNVFAPTNGTFELWYRSTDTNNNRYFAGTYNYYGGYCFKASNSFGGTVSSFFYIEDDNHQREVKQTSNINIRDGRWHHLAATWTNGTLALWIDGAFENSVSATTPQRVGGNLLLGTVPLPPFGEGGILAHAEACDIALARLSSSVRYTEEFNPPTTLSSDDNALGLWTMNQVVGVTAYDSSDSGFDLELVPDSHQNYPVWGACDLLPKVAITSVPMAANITYESASILWAVTNSTGQIAAHTVHYRLNGSEDIEVAVAQENPGDGQVSVTLTNLLAGRTYDYFVQSSNEFASVRIPTGTNRYNRFNTELLNGIGSYLDFNGSNYAAATMENTDVFAPTNGTFELWYRSTDTNDNRYIAGTYNYWGGFSFKVSNSLGSTVCSFCFLPYSSGLIELRQTTISVNIRDGRWHHLAATWNNGTLALWIDGAFENSTSFSNNLRPGGNPMFGAVPQTIYKIDNLLTPAEACDIALARLSSSVRYSAAFAAPTNLLSDNYTVGLWTMDEGIGVIADDSSDNDYDATLVSDSNNHYPTWGSTGISPTIAITSGPTAFDITNESASIVWAVTNTTAQAATHKIRYWLDGVAGASTNCITADTDPGNGLVSVSLTNLLAGHTYDYYVQSSNTVMNATAPAGSPGYSSFGTPPWIVVGIPSYSNLNTNSVDITWSVQNDSATTATHSVTLFSGSQAITNFFIDPNPGPVVTNVILSVTNLTRGLTYNYTVTSFINDANDYGSNHFVGYYATNGSVFTVPTQPLIGVSGLYCTNVTPGGMDVIWTVANSKTNSATHLVTYMVDGTGPVSDPFFSATNAVSGQVSVHLSGLQPATTYYCVAQSILNGMSNYYVPELTMASMSIATNTPGMRITNAPTFGAINGYSFNLSWGFQNNSGTGVYHMVTYGPTGASSGAARTVTAYTPSGVNSVSVSLRGLDPSSTYAFVAGSIPQEGTGQTSYYATTNGTFTTPSFSLPQLITIDSVTNSVVTDTMALVTWHVDKIDPDDVAFHYVVFSTNGVPTNVVSAIVTEGFEDPDGNVMAVLTDLTPYTNSYYYVQSVIDSAPGHYAADTNSGSFYSVLPGFAWFTPWDFGVVTNFVSALTNDVPVSVFLTNQFSESSRWVLTNTNPNVQELGPVLSDELNKIIGGGSNIYNSTVFTGVTLSIATTNLLAQASQYGDFVRLNRMLLQDAYPDYISTNLMVDMLPVDTSGDDPIIAMTGTPTTNGVTDTMAWITWNVTITNTNLTNYAASHFVVYSLDSTMVLTNALIATGVQGTNGIVMALLEGLWPGSNYYYYVQSVIDPSSGHYVTDDNFGGYYEFTTRTSNDDSDYSITGNQILDWWKSVYGFNPLNQKTASKRWIGTGPLFWDSDQDGVVDWRDAFPMDPTQSQMPTGGNPGGPTITLIEPAIQPME